MSIEKEQVNYIAGLARLSLSETETLSMQNDLGNILKYIEKLNELDTSGIEPTSHVVGITNVWRDDKPGVSLSQEEVFSNSPDTDGRFYKVPRIIEG